MKDMVKQDNQKHRMIRMIGWILAGSAVLFVGVYIVMMLMFLNVFDSSEDSPAHEKTNKPLIESQVPAGISPEVPRDTINGLSMGNFHKSADTEGFDPVIERFKLLGTSTGRGKSARAYILDSGTGERRIVNTGEFLAGLEIAMITDREVFLTSGTRLLSLYMGEGIRTGAKDSAHGKFSVCIRRRDLDYFVKYAHREGHQVTIYPVQTNGKVQGVIVNNIPPGLLLMKMGICNEDIIVGINGNKINSVRDFSFFLKQAIEADPHVLFDVIRSSRSVQVGFKIY